MGCPCQPAFGLVSLLLVCQTGLTDAAQLANGRPTVVLQNQQARLVVDLKGGAIADFHLRDHPTNPLNWGTPKEGDAAIRRFGHFLCLDRWGPPSETEGAKGMPYRGLEFGTTGLHQPFSVLARKGQIWERPLFEYLDAGQSMVRRYLCFLLRVPKDFAGVESLGLEQGKLVLRERERAPVREQVLDLQGLTLD